MNRTTGVKAPRDYIYTHCINLTTVNPRAAGDKSDFSVM